MNKKLLLSIVLLSGSLALSSCSLFNDNDIMEPNIFNPQYDEPEVVPPGTPVIDGVAEKDAPSDAGEGTKVFKNVGYAPYDEENDRFYVTNTYKVGGAHHMGYNINNGNDYLDATSLKNNYDLYVPSASKTPRDQKHIVILFIHGGAWTMGVKTDVNPYIHDFASKGYITATIKYTLLRNEMDDPSLSIFRNLDEIDACIKSIKNSLASLGFDTTKSQLVIGGASSGAHLAMLYAYSRGKESAIPIKFVVDGVGPVDIKPDAWKDFTHSSESILDAGLDKNALAIQENNHNLSTLKISDGGSETKYWDNYETFRIANGMCGMPYSLAEVEEAKTNPSAASYVDLTSEGHGEDQLSVTYWIKKADEASKFPIICAYAGLDYIVGINQFATLQRVLDEAHVTYYSNPSDNVNGYVYFRNSKHEEITEEKDPVNYQRLIDAVDSWCTAETI